MTNPTTKELHTGLNGRGATQWLVVTVNADGSWKHVERFDTEHEALNWLRWA